MKKVLALILVLCFLGVTVMSGFQFSRAENRTIFVPDDYLTVSSAIKNAEAGDIIKVKSGVFNEEKLEINKQLTIISEIPYQAVLNFKPSTYPTCHLGLTMLLLNESISIHADNVMLSGFTITIQVDKIPEFNDDESKTVDNHGYILAYGNQIQVTNNLLGSKAFPISLRLFGNNNQVINNTVQSVYIDGKNQTISDNTLSVIVVTGSKNQITTNTAGVLRLADADNNIISDNSFTKNQSTGIIQLDGADYNTFSNNTVVTDILFGVGFAYPDGQGGSHNLFKYNTVEGATFSAIHVGLGDYNVFYGNIIANNDGHGITMGGTHKEANYNLFYGNIFMNNTKNFGANWDVVGINFFDNGSMGNYWDDYLTKYPNAAEKGDSGTGNMPYEVYGSVVDNFPLMNKPDLQSILDTQNIQNMQNEKETDSEFSNQILLALAILTIIVTVIVVIKRKTRYQHVMRASTLAHVSK